ncbi:anoctamin-2-like isoform X2 [Haematobia irritans]|uniref:anoctamin-2-like isoform X2 n=1 Tax=Haematobia irritans TaxID=7368 RepID=UPI003F509497
MIVQYRHFKDGIRKVDFVLAFNTQIDNMENIKKRTIFETNLEKEGLHLERDISQHIHFVKIHIPNEVLYRYAEILKVKLPMITIPGQHKIYENNTVDGNEDTLYEKIFKCIKVKRDKFPTKSKCLYSEFQRKYHRIFDYERPNFFDAGTRIYIINFILERQHFVDCEETANNFGIEKLLADGVYECAYSLHEEEDRQILLKEWASLRKWMHIQPLDAIKDYFGAKIAIYYAWLGFYAHMLIPLSILGILVFVYGFFTWNSDSISHQICSSNKSTLMCPLCDRNCDYWELSKTCRSSKINYLIDNNMTVIYAFLMSIWAIIYLELWKRYSANLIYRWGLTGYSNEVEHPRPQYLKKLSKDRKLAEKLKQLDEENLFDLDMPYWKTKFFPSLTSYSLMLLAISISLIAIAGMIVYRMAQMASHTIFGEANSMTARIMLMPATAGCIDLIIISVLHYAYSYLAKILTNLEYCRTQTEYDESLTLKIYSFQFVNYYSSLFYIAFVKGKFVGYPREYNRLFNLRQQECNPGGCLMELCLQLVIIMIGKQVVNGIVEITVPLLKKRLKKKCTSKNKQKLQIHNQWTKDYHLQPWSSSLMFAEYLEMVIQYGFVTLFGLAFPLAPLFALINNVIEVRTDALKMLKYIRRPMAQRAHEIGVWFNIMQVVTRIAVTSCALIIAFSTNFIPKLVYVLYSGDTELTGYLNFTLAHFNTKDFEIQPRISTSQYANVTSCLYPDLRNPPWHPQPYERPVIYWKLLLARVVFVVLFQNITGAIQTVIAWAIPDVPKNLIRLIKSENFLLREYIIEYEKHQAMEVTTNDVTSWINHVNEEENGDEYNSLASSNEDYIKNDAGREETTSL